MPTPTFQITQTDLDKFNSAGVDVFVNNVAVTLNMSVKSGDIMRAVCRSGFKFYLVSNYYGYSLIPSFSVLYLDSWSEAHQFTGVLEGSETELEFEIKNIYGSGVYYSGIICLTEQTTEEVTGSNKIYIVDSSNIATINIERYQTVTNVGANGGTTSSIYDYGQFIISLIQIPFAIPEDIIGENENIKLANKALTTDAPLLLREVLTVDLGTIFIPHVHNNSMDYTDTKAILHLPLSPSVELNLEYVIGHEISIQYLVDLYTGNATINIFSDRIESPIETKKVSLGVVIPYGSTANRILNIDNTNIEIGGDNGVKTPFIEIIRGNFLLINNKFTIPVEDSGPLPELGFIKVNEIQLENSNATYDEKQEILTVLSNGVIIK